MPLSRSSVTVGAVEHEEDEEGGSHVGSALSRVSPCSCSLRRRSLVVVGRIGDGAAMACVAGSGCSSSVSGSLCCSAPCCKALLSLSLQGSSSLYLCEALLLHVAASYHHPTHAPQSGQGSGGIAKPT